MAGVVLQFFFGGFRIGVLAFPVNLIVAGLLVVAVGVLALYREKGAFGLLSGVAFSVTAIAALLICCLVMGLIPQIENGGLLTGVTSSWPFVFIYLALLFSLGCVIANSLARFNIRRWGFYLNHIGLWLVLAGAGFGRADFRELTVKIPEGETATHGIDDQTMMPHPLPFALRLDDFGMEEYPPMPGTDMRMPKSFTADITVIFRDGREEIAAIEVNHPYRHKSWAFYQSGYDRKAGPESTYSVLKAVRDPWLPMVYAGIIMLAVGAFSMFGSKMRTKNGLE